MRLPPHLRAVSIESVSRMTARRPTSLANASADAVRDGQNQPRSRGFLRLLDELHLADDHSLVDRLRHVVHGERRNRDRDERLHLDAGLGRRLRRRFDLYRIVGNRERDVDVRQRERMAERDELGRRFAAMMPASFAVTSASPFGSSVRLRASLGAIRTRPRATARRRSGGFAPTSTM